MQLISINENEKVIYIRVYFNYCFPAGIGSCRTGKNYQRPTVLLPEKFNQTFVADTNSIADLPWKNYFTDPVLQAADRQRNHQKL